MFRKSEALNSYKMQRLQKSGKDLTQAENEPVDEEDIKAYYENEGAENFSTPEEEEL